jgi:hypothetical protein
LVLAIEPENQKSLVTQLLKPFIFYHRMVLVAGFADVDAIWQWGPPVSTSLSSPLSFFSPLTPSLTVVVPHASPTPAPTAPLQLRRPAALHHSPPSLATPPLLRARAG